MSSGPQCADPMTAGSQRAGCDNCSPDARHISRRHFDTTGTRRVDADFGQRRASAESTASSKVVGLQRTTVDPSELQVDSLPIINIMSGNVLNVRSTWVIGGHCGGSMNSIVSPCGPTAYITRVPTFAPPAIG